MRHFQYLSLVFLGCLFLSGCNFGCDLESTVASGITSTVAATLQCSNPDAIKASVTSLLGKTGICSAKKHGLVNGLVCPAVAALALEQIGKLPPAAWGCTMTGVTATVDAVLLQACSAIPF